MAQANNMHNLTTLIKRLEAATSRLEDIASSAVEIPQAVPGIQETLASPGTSSTKAAALAAATAPGAGSADEPLPEVIEEFDAFLKASVDKYVGLSQQLGGLIAEQAVQVAQGFAEERKFLLISTRAKKPNLSISEDMDAYQALLKPINESLMAVVAIKEANRGSAVSNQLSAVADGIMMLAWVTDESKPHKHVENTLGSAQYYGHRVIKDYKDKDQVQIDWIQSFLAIIKDLTEYIQLHFASGLRWNFNGLPLQEFVKSLSAAPPAAAAAAAPAPPPTGALPPPPPPPPGPPPVLQINDEKSAAPSSTPAGGFGAVFSELNQGENVTRGLRKVDKSQMTHKNPTLRANSTDEGGSRARGKSPAPARKAKPEGLRAKKPPVQVLEGNKWTIAHYEKEVTPITIEVQLAHSVLISKCSSTTIIIKGKANAVTVENTSRVSLVVDNLVSSVDVVKSHNFGLQVMGTVPSVLMDSVDGVQIYFSKESISTRIIHSKSAGINLNVLAGPDDDYIEVPLPGQIESYYDPVKKALVDRIVSHAG